MRPNELAALRWENIGFLNETIQVKKGIVRGKEDLPKTKAAQRLIPMAPAVVQTLVALQKRAGVVSHKGYVFRHKSGEPLDDHVDRIWARALRRAGIRHRKSYNLRHTFATNCIIAGLPLPYIAKILGHTTIDALVRNYAGWINSESDTQASKFKEAFAGTKVNTQVAQKVAQVGMRAPRKDEQFLDTDDNGGEGGIRTHVACAHPLSRRRRYDRFGTSPQ